MSRIDDKTPDKETKTGRPSKYQPEYVNQVVKLCRLGATDKAIADFFEVNEDTINEWKKRHPEFSEALKRGKLQADAEVADKLFQRATGYSHPDVDIKVISGKIRKTKLIKHYPPDTTAAIFWLKNRAKEIWREKQHIQFDPEEATEEQLDRIVAAIIEDSKKNKK